jgi:hypothetical protein
VLSIWELLQDSWKNIPYEAERMPRVCKAVIKAKGGYFEEYKIYLDLFNTFLVNTWFHLWYVIVVMSSWLFYNVGNIKIKKTPWMSRSKLLACTVHTYKKMAFRHEGWVNFQSGSKLNFKFKMSLNFHLHPVLTKLKWNWPQRWLS